MPKYQVLLWCLNAMWVLFAFAYGACLGSLTNVIVYRWPRDESIVRPPSRCPKCGTKLSWRDNIPVLGWILLKGKCRYCKTRISPEYPIVEAAVGLLFVVFYLIWYAMPAGTTVLGVPIYTMTPRWAMFNDPYHSWPEFVVLLALVASLFAMTLVDAKTFTIPIKLTWAPAIVAIAVYPAHAAWSSVAGHTALRATPGWRWVIPTPELERWDLIGLSAGGLLGLGIGLLLVKTGLIGQSFADFAEWEEKANAQAEAKKSAGIEPALDSGSAAAPGGPGTDPAPSPAPVQSPPTAGSPAPEASAVPGTSDPELWMDYPHARREMVRELAFLAPCVLLMITGWYLGGHLAGMSVDHISGLHRAQVLAPLWLTVLSGVILGYLIGGGVVWFVRIAGSIAFGREAMGMGDVHLMAGVGACLGWIDATLGFFGAAFVGLGWAILGRVAGGKFKRMLPYGPFLAVSTVLIVLGKPLVEVLISRLVGHHVRLP